MKRLKHFIALMLFVLAINVCSNAQVNGEDSLFPSYMRNDFDFANFARFEVAVPPRSDMYQSNGYLALREKGYGSQSVVIPTNDNGELNNGSDRLSVFQLNTPVITNISGHNDTFSDNTAVHKITYYADRTAYDVKFSDGIHALLTVYPVYGVSGAVARLKILQATDVVSVQWSYNGTNFSRLPTNDRMYGASERPYRLFIGSNRHIQGNGDAFNWRLAVGDEAIIVMATGGNERDAKKAFLKISKSNDAMDRETHKQWNAYLASVPLVAPAKSIRFELGKTGEYRSISPEELVQSEIWFWRGVLTNTCVVPYLPATPLMIADWNVFFGMWGNDGVEEAVSLAGTGRSDLARGAILSWFRYAVNAKGDGSTSWVLFPSGHNSYMEHRPVANTESVPLQAHMVGEYVRLTGDTNILSEKIHGKNNDRTLWQVLIAYQNNLLSVRDVNHDHLVEWTHVFETGWDDKNSPFVDFKGNPTSALNEQAFNLWSLKEMVYLAKMQGDDPSPWEHEYSTLLSTIQTKLWDLKTQRYWDFDVRTGKLWTQGENLDAYYLLNFENDPDRIKPMMQRFHDPAKFNSVLLPTMAFDNPRWGGYWRGPAWPRIFGYVAMGLEKSGYGEEGFTWLARAIHSNLGPLLPETVEPQKYPSGQYLRGPVRIMGYDAIDTLIFPELAGLHTWGGDDLTVLKPVFSDKVFVRSQWWMGDHYDAILERGHPTLLYRNGDLLKSLPSGITWKAQKHGSDVSFEPVRHINN